MVSTKSIQLNSKGHTDILDITELIQSSIREGEITSGIALVFTPSATSGITTIEFENGCIQDLKRFFEDILGSDRYYAHNARWGDGNGHSHIRAALLGPSLSIPFAEKEIILGTWQQIIFVDFDNRPRQRKLVLQLLGE
ncbi:MAG: secondary thiamine-phosphate synthase enzyme YjbQ [Anaerolineaceae bacterium]|nr:secondary thiamine-phosphate synthase enzyme YjbQ [Anaerolineaceae bacterium]